MNRKNGMYYLAFLFGIVLVAVSIAFSPAFVAKYVKHVPSLDDEQTAKLLAYRFYALTGGFLAIVLSLWLGRTSRRLSGVLWTIVLISLYVIGTYHVYIHPKYPDNIICDVDGIGKAARVLMGKEYVTGDYDPRPALVVDNQVVLKSRFKAIDSQFFFSSMDQTSPEELVEAMDLCGVEKVVAMDGEKGKIDDHINRFIKRYPGRFYTFGVLNLNEFNQKNFIENQLNLLNSLYEKGIRGLKVYKYLGLMLEDSSGKRVPIDDARLEPIWNRVEELKIPVLIHTGDPTPFFHPIDRHNERFDELREFPEWSWHGDRFPAKETLLRERENLVGKHPKINFILPHMGDNPEDLAYLGRLLDRYPNLYVNISSRLPELGRQPYTARKFFIKYQDRILFATDGGFALKKGGLWSAERYFRSYFTFLETTNEYMEYPLWGINKQGRWRIYGIGLPDQVLKKIYYMNAEKIINLN